MQPPKTPNIRAVSKAAGFSVATVSRVLNNSPIPTEATRQRVWQAVRATGYRPDPLFSKTVRRSRRKQTSRTRNERTGIVGFLTNRRVYQCYHSPAGFYSQSAYGLEEILREHEQYLLWLVVEQDESALPHAVADRRVDAIVIEGDIPRPMLDVLVRRLPTVLISRSYPGLAASSVVVNSPQAMQCQLEYLWELGHRRIAFFQPQVNLPQFRVCDFAYRDFYASRGLPVPCPDLVECRDINPATHEQVMQQYARELLKSRSHPTAVVASNLYAHALAYFLQQMGRSIPQDFSVASLTDEMGSMPILVKPALTTFHFSSEEVGRTAGRLVLEEIENPSQPKRNILVNGHPIERASCAPPPDELS